MTRLDLFTAPGPACPAARQAVASFARERPDVVVREWDLTRDPGPAVGRGIVATPAVLVNGRRILLGIPDGRELAEAVTASGGGPSQRAEVGGPRLRGAGAVIRMARYHRVPVRRSPDRR